MSSSSQDIDPFFKLLTQLCVAHGMPSPDNPDEIREFAFTPGGVSYRLMPHPEDDTQALLEIDIQQLESLLDNADAAPALERLLRTLLQLNAVLQDHTQWVISLDDDDVLVLSVPVSLVSSSAEALQMLALEGLQRARALLELSESCS